MRKAREEKENIPKLSFFSAFKRAFSLVKPEWPTLVWGLFFLLLGSGMGLAFPQAIRVVIDGALQGGMTSINTATLVMLGIFLIQGVSVCMRSYLFSLVGFRVVTGLQRRTYYWIMEQEIGFFDRRKTGELLNRLSSDSTVLQNTVSSNISMLLRNAVMTVGGFGLLIFTSPVLTLLMLVVVPPVSLGAVWFGKKIRNLSKTVQDELARAGEIAEETISGIRTVRSFAKEPMEVSRYAKAIHLAFGSMKDRAVGMALFIGIVTFAGYSSVAMVLWYGGRLVVAGTLSIGDLTSFILYTLIIAFSIGTLGTLYTDFMRSIGAAERIFELLDRKTLIPNQGGKTLSKVEGRLRFENVSFSYPSREGIPALEHVSFSMQPGEVIALVGPSGAGKTTIANLIPRFYDPQGGRILLDETPITELNPSWLREQIGTVAQEPILFSRSIAENIGYSNESASREEIENAAKVANAYEFIQTFPDGYDTQVGERGIRLSGGQKQRVAIARAVLKDPKILILDEATSALDAQSEFLVKEALDRLREGRTTLIIAHRLSTVKDANRVMVVEAGKIVETGRHEELMTKEEGRYRLLVERQFILDSEN